MMVKLLSFHLLFQGDFIIVNLLTIVYILETFYFKKGSKKLIFPIFSILIIYWLHLCIYLFSSLTLEGVKGICKIDIIPLLLFLYLLLPVRKNKRTKTLIIISIIVYFSFWALLLLFHHFSNM